LSFAESKKSFLSYFFDQSLFENSTKSQNKNFHLNSLKAKRGEKKLQRNFHLKS
jgi:hypothetical protein